MSFAASFAHDVPYHDAANCEGISDERTVTAPGDGFSAHQDSRMAVSQINQLVEVDRELRRLHIVGETAERRIPPARVR